jgi:hypothetical protein
MNSIESVTAPSDHVDDQGPAGAQRTTSDFAVSPEKRGSDRRSAIASLRLARLAYPRWEPPLSTLGPVGVIFHRRFLCAFLRPRCLSTALPTLKGQSWLLQPSR